MPTLFLCQVRCTLFCALQLFSRGNKILNSSQNISLSPAPNCNFSLPRSHHSTVKLYFLLEIGGSWCHTPHQEVKRDVRSVFSSSICYLQIIITLPGKNLVIYHSFFPIHYFLYIIFMFIEDLAPDLSSASSHSAIHVTFYFCEWRDFGFFFFIIPVSSEPITVAGT